MKRVGILSVAFLLVIPVFLFTLLGSGGADSQAASGRQVHSIPLKDIAYNPNELLVKVRSEIGPAAAKKMLGAMGAQKVQNLAGGIELVTLPAELTIADAIKLYSQDPNILEVSPNYRRKALQTTPDDDLFADQWNMNNTGQVSGYKEDADIDAPEAWDETQGDREVIIVVLDTGVDYTHPDLAPNMWVNRWELINNDATDLLERMTNGVDDDGDGVIDDFDGQTVAGGSKGPWVFNGAEWKQLPILKFDGVNDDAVAETTDVIDDFDGVKLDGLDSVIDAGVYADDLFGINAMTDSGNPFDDVGHGTHVAGIIGAEGNNSIGVAGVNWRVRIMACKFMDLEGGSIADEIKCLRYIKGMAEKNEPIVAVNASFGGRFPSFTLEAQEIFNLLAPGILLVAAAGNDSTDNDGFPLFPAAYNQPHILAVAATDRADLVPSFSNFGNQKVHLGAPGVYITSTLPGNTYGSGVSGMSGTSMAAPHVTGAVGLLYSFLSPGAPTPVSDYFSVRNRILAGGDLNTYLNRKTVTGRRLSVFGAMTCDERKITARLSPPTSEYVSWINGAGTVVEYTVIPGRNQVTAILGEPVTLSLLHINCGDPGLDSFSVTVDGQAVSLLDNGILPDIEGDDGIFSGNWTPTAVGSFVASFPNRGTSSSDYTDTFTIIVLDTNHPLRQIVADAGSNQSVRELSSIELDGSLSGIGTTDIAQPLFYEWECHNAAGPVALVYADSPFPIFNAPAYVPPVEGDPNENVYTAVLSVFLPGTAEDENGDLMVFPDGDPATDTIQITVNAQPIAHFSASASSGYAPLSVCFTDESLQDATQWSWNFGDGSLASAEQNPCHEFENSGAYDVCLTATNQYGSNTYCSTITVNDVPADGGGGGGGTACFIATAAYGSNDVRYLPVLRSFRDTCLLTNLPGQTFVRLYYRLSPPVASFIAEHAAVRSFVRVALLPLVAFAQVALRVAPLLRLFVLMGVISILGATITFKRTRGQARFQ